MSSEGWKMVELSDIIDFDPVESIPKNSIAKKIDMEKLLPFTRKVIGYTESEFKGGSKFRNGDTLFARITPCLENGKTAIVDILSNNEVGFGSTEFIVLRSRKDISDEKYVYYLSISNYVRNKAIKSMAGTSGRQRVQKNVLADIKIPCPPLTEQRAIADTLSCLDDMIELNNRTNKVLEEMAQAIFKHWFVDFEFPNENGEPYKSSGGEMVGSELGEIPKGWKVGVLEDIGEIIGGSTPSKKNPDYYTDNGIAWITPKDLSVDKSKFFSKGSIDITSLGLKNSSARIMPRGTVLFSSRAPIGYIAIAQNDITTNQGFKSVVPNKKVGTAYVYCFLKENLALIESRASGSTFKEISGSAMKQIPVLVPNEDILISFNKQFELSFDLQEKIEEENRKLSLIRDTLLPKLMSGEIRVPIEEVG